MSASSPTTPTDMESTNHDSPSTTNANVPPVVEDAVDEEVPPNNPSVATNATTSTPVTSMGAPVPLNLTATATANYPRLMTTPVLPNMVVLPNRGVDLALSDHRSG